ncbi:galanin receptor type 1-like isoform X1 [Brienomyrus brachyistius]|uniref:galanin receptor type 1-like isoform X1 n=1 Tax=Brienomyrus brachyistius TaxID=42636 RepID=UPI0020B3CB77|nr:galanin receptor type 1-like isoform X1 [Brienomyrus brachyistius]
MESTAFSNHSDLRWHSNQTNDAVSPPKLLFGIGTDNFITLLVFGLIFILGVVGNSMVITVLARSKPGKPRGTTNIFILNLSIADLSYLLFCIPFQSTVYMLDTWVLGAFICKFIHYFFTVSMLVSIFTLSAMSVDRYIAIVHSRKSSSIRVAKHALIGVALIWILSFAMAAPVAYNQNIVQRNENNTYCWEVWPDQSQKKVYVVCTFIFGYVLPLLLISFCYTKVLNHLHKKLKNMSKKSEASKKKTAQTVLVVVVVFCLSWLPHHVVHLWVEFGSFPLNQASFLFRVAAHCLAYSNSSVNPIIYGFLSENFRKAYKQVFRCQVASESPLNDIKEIRSKVDTPPSTNCTNV